MNAITGYEKKYENSKFNVNTTQKKIHISIFSEEVEENVFVYFGTANYNNEIYFINHIEGYELSADDLDTFEDEIVTKGFCLCEHENHDVISFIVTPIFKTDNCLIQKYHIEKVDIKTSEINYQNYNKTNILL